MLRKLNFKQLMSGSALALVCLGAFGITAVAQQSTGSVKVASNSKDKKDDASADGDKVKAVDSAGPAIYQPGKRSPFEDPKRRPPTVRPATERAFPAISERLSDYMARRARAKANGTAVPSALSAYLVNELEVNGVFKTKEGYGAFVRALPTNQTYFVRVGDKAFNGEIKRVDPKQVVFTSITWMTSGKDIKTEVTKVIQQPSSAQGATAEKQ
ncbi:MAG TPA: hypothetical protein VFC63_26170 [Blastocatellia bacterium]|nr:hypothetical protein [Blastocatellia bacterium]